MRIGTTSCIWHDHMLPNVRKLAPLVDDVELLLFSVDEDVPPPAEVRELAAIARDHDLTYTLHTPLDASLASADAQRRQLGVDKVRRAIDWARPLSPFATTVHVYLGDRERDPSPPADLDAWRARAAESLATLRRESDQLCVECIDYDFALIAPVVRELGLSVALDVGHLMRDGKSLRAAVDAHLARTRVIQLHGTRPDDGRDHKSLRYAPPAELDWLVRALASFSGVLTLEVFDPDDFSESMKILSDTIDAMSAIIAMGTAP